MAPRRKSHRPASPADIARRRSQMQLAKAEEPPAIDAAHLALPVNAEVKVAKDGAGRVVRARRQDVFDLLCARGKLTPSALTAVRRLQEDMAVLHRTISCGGDLAPRVDRSRRPESFGEARLAAGARIEATLSRAGPITARLLVALVEPEVVGGRSIAWREIVARETGETLPDAQGAVLRIACENLAEAYGAGWKTAASREERRGAAA